MSSIEEDINRCMTSANLTEIREGYFLVKNRLT